MYKNRHCRSDNTHQLILCESNYLSHLCIALNPINTDHKSFNQEDLSY